MRINGRTIICFFVVVIISLGALVGGFIGSGHVIWVSILAIYAVLVWYTVRSGDSTIIYIGFLITFFTFLLGKYGFQAVVGRLDPMLENSIFVKESIYVYLSLISLFIGYNVFRKKRRITDSIIGSGALETYINSTRMIGIYAKYFFLFCVIFSFIVNVDIASRTFGTIYGLNTISSRMPFVVQKIAQMSGMFYWIFLSTLPDSKKAKLPTILFILNTALTLLTGARGTTVRDVMAVGLYYYFRHKSKAKLNDNTVWVSKTMKIIIIVMVPVMIVFLGLFAHIRLGEGLQFSGFFKGLQMFFDQQGGSVDVIGRAIYCQDRNLLPSTNISYTFGPVINLFRNGIFGRLLGLQVVSSGEQTAALAMQGNNLGATVTYIMAQAYYNIGGGFGTCYIAELAVDFGYVGVIAFNLFLGWLLNNVNYFISRKWWLNAVGLLIIRDILYMPRDFALSFISSIFSATNLLALLLMMIISKSMRSSTLGVKLTHENCKH